MQKSFKNLILKQSYTDSYEDYRRTLCGDASCWDFCIITASSEAQAAAYLEQIEYRKQRGLLPKSTHFAVIPDKDGKRIGSGGATLSAMRYIKEVAGKDSFRGIKALVIHSGGDSKRVPQYSVCGKLFSPIPRELENERRSTLFDEIIIATSGVPQRIPDGMFICSGDVLLIFNPLQIDFYSKGAAAITVAEDVSVGVNHGVFVPDENGNVGKFLHKLPANILQKSGAVNERNKVNIDTGAVIFESHLLDALYSLIDTDKKFSRFVNEQVRLNFYADFLYPLASKSSIEDYYKQMPEGEFSDELKNCRTEIFKAISQFRIKLIQCSPAAFMHIGTTAELLNLQTNEIDNYNFIGWKRCVNSNVESENYSVSNSIIDGSAKIGSGTYIEDSYVCENTIIGSNCIISGLTLKDVTVPDGTVLHGLKLKNGKFCVRMYGVNDNPKENLWFSSPIECALWDEKLFTQCDTIDKAVFNTLNKVKSDELLSLNETAQNADFGAVLPWRTKLADIIKCEKFIDLIKKGSAFHEIEAQFVQEGLKKRVIKLATKRAKTLPLNLKIRVYYFISKFLEGKNSEKYKLKCFSCLRDEIIKNCDTPRDDRKIMRESVVSKLPVRVNFGGGWTDTPPYCNENGGTVLNAAILLDDRLPAQAELKRISEEKIVLTSADSGSYKEFFEIDELLDCSNPHDPYALQKASLIACGIVPLDASLSLSNILKKLGGGIYFSTQVINIPRGSGLGTSSILAAACVKGIYEFLGEVISEADVCDRVLQIEQLMSTGGGWQDQMGGLVKGIKLLSSKPGIIQNVEYEKLELSPNTLKELEDRFCLIYTGQRRLARNLLRKVMGKYIENDMTAITTLSSIKDMAIKMKNALKKGDVDAFAKLLSDHFELVKQLDPDSTNTCLDHIFYVCDDLIAGKMICGAGGSGFLQVVLKKGVTKEMLRERLNLMFIDAKVEVWDCSFYM